MRVKGSKKAFLWTYERNCCIHLNVKVSPEWRDFWRGAGNCAMELLLGFLKNSKYKVYPVYQFIEETMIKLKEEGTVWGYDLQYLMTGQLNQHPRTAIQFTKENRKDYTEFYKEIQL